jgi:DNA mismatch endonuclease, patch repair protein
LINPESIQQEMRGIRAWQDRVGVVDTFSKSVRSQIMRSVHSTGTGAEKKCEALLRSVRLSFRRHAASLPGRPDFILRACGLALFVHGCFWHAHKGCKAATLPSSNTDYWRQKIDRNRKRDRRVRNALRKAGWRTAVVWECKLRDTDSVARRLLKLASVGRNSREKLG